MVWLFALLLSLTFYTIISPPPPTPPKVLLLISSYPPPNLLAITGLFGLYFLHFLFLLLLYVAPALYLILLLLFLLFYVTLALFLFLHLLFLLLICGTCTISLPFAIIPSPKWQLHISLPSAIISSLLCGTCTISLYYSSSLYVATALFLFHLLLFLLLICGTCTISLSSAIIPSPYMWHLHYFSSFCYYSLFFYLALALILFLLVLFNSIIYLSSFLPFSPLLNHNLHPLSLPLSDFAYSVVSNPNSYYFALLSFVHFPFHPSFLRFLQFLNGICK